MSNNSINKNTVTLHHPINYLVKLNHTVTCLVTLHQAVTTYVTLLHFLINVLGTLTNIPIT